MLERTGGIGAPFIDPGNAGFSSSAAARQAINAANPLSPGGLNPRNTSVPTIVWAVVFAGVLLLLYHTVVRR